MKRLLASALLLIAGAVAAATTTPVQLLNPTGSTAGQAIVSTGPTTYPQWGTVTAGGVTPITGNSVYANFTGSSASPIANAVPSCSTANSALKYTTSTGLSCGTTFALTSGNLSQFASTTSAQLATLLSDETGSGAAVFGTSPTLATPTLNQPTINGRTNGTNPGAGVVGEPLTSTGTAVSLTNSVSTNCASVNLSAGDWDVWGYNFFNPGSGVSLTVLSSSLSTTTNTHAASPDKAQIAYSGTTNFGQSLAAPMRTFNVTSVTTVYLVATGGFASGTATVSCRMYARRRS